MNDANEMQLMRAYELIEAGDLAGARAIIEPIIIDDRNNADVWWIYAHAVDDAPSASRALDNVLRLDPEYPGARELRAQLAVALGEVPAPPPPMPDSLPDAPVRAATSRPMGEPQPIQRAPSQLEQRRSPLLPILGLVAILAIIIVILLLLSQPAPTEIIPTETSIVAQGAITDEIIIDETQVVETAATDAVETTETPLADGEGGISTDEPVESSDLSGLYTALAAFNVEDGAIAISETSAGNALLASICSTSGAQLREDLPAALLAMASASASLESDAALIGVQMIDCTNDTALRTVVVNLTDAVAFANGGLDSVAFQTRWQSL